MTCKAFLIEVKVCASGKLHKSCKCRWTVDNYLKCTSKCIEMVCEVDNSVMRMSLLVRRMYSEVVWELLEDNSLPVVLNHTKLQVNCKFLVDDPLNVCKWPDMQALCLLKN